MELIFDKKEFNKYYKIGSALCGRSKVLPILDFVKFELTKKEVYLYSSDGDNMIKVNIPIIDKTSDVLDFCIKGSELRSYVQAISSDCFRINIANVGATTCSIIHDNGVGEMPIESALSFPTFNFGESKANMTIESSLLYNWINNGMSFTSDDELRPIMNGMYLYCNEDCMGYCCTDAHQLINDYIGGSYNTKFSVVINKKALMPILSILGEDDKCNITIFDGNTEVKVGESVVICRNIEGNYPNFKAVIPVINDSPVSVDKAELIASLNRSRILGNKTSRLVIVTVENDVLTLKSQDLDFSTNNKESIACEYNGSKQIGLNIDKFITVLNSCTMDKVLLYINNSSRPILIKETESSNKQVILMPMLISD